MQCKSDGNMEDVPTENVCLSPPAVFDTPESQGVKSTESAENFQKFMYELFEKNGVINDLRAYLRGHIVGLLRSARTGDPPPCQKHFTQRLELPYQALNMLIAEYLLRLQFSYTLSVFVSEIPLANMVLDFAKSLMQGCSNAELRFKDEDVWSILNYLGVKCDSDHASNIVEMYRKETQSPLLLCMLKCMPMYTPIGLNKDSSQESVTSSAKSSDTVGGSSRRTSSRCKHLVFCKTCHGNMLRIKEKCKKKKTTLTKNIKESSVKPQKVEPLVKNIDVVERSLIDEMFQQLRSVYDAEMQMAKTDEEERVKRSLATHAVQLNRKRIEMEENFKARELELSHNVQQKKRFLWGLARLLRDQHRHMARAMHRVQHQAARLTEQEDNLKSQLAEAEAVLRARGEDMRQQISAELATLEGHLDSMKKERDTINKERSELEHMKHLCDGTAKTTNIETTKDLNSHYDLLRNEFNILKKYLETAKAEPKRVTERSTLTEDDSTRTDGVLNNGQDLERSRSEDRVKAKRVVNDLKKMKNVNFSQSNLAEIYRERSRSSPSHSTVSSEGGDAAREPPRRDATRRDATRRLMEENERLRTFARQQREHIDELSSQQARLQAELTAARLPLPPAPRPRTAPAVMPNHGLLQRMSANGAAAQVAGHGWRQGAGEEMALFASAPPRILVPGDTVPFIGVVRDRHSDSRRYLINQWRSLRRRVSPVGAGGAGGRRAPARDVDRERASSAGPSVRITSEEDLNNNANQADTLDHSYKLSREQFERPKSSEKPARARDRNPKSLLKDTKEKLKTRDYFPRADRDPSPNTVIRDAKLRLRKLEIEAEAVERSYLDFRRKQDQRHKPSDDRGETSAKEIDSKHKRLSFKADASRVESTSRYTPAPDPAYEQVIEDIDEYRAKYDIGATRFNNKNATPMKVRPIPTTAHDTPKRNYLDTSMTEFRKYYQAEKRTNEERPMTSRNRDFEIPRSQFASPRPDDRLSPMRNRKEDSDCETSPKSPLSRKEETIEKNEPNSPKEQPISLNTDTHARSPKIKGLRTEGLRQTKHDKAKELEILKQNISKIYNLPENTMAENNENYNEAVENAQREMENERKGIIEETITEVSRDETGSEPGSKDPTEDRNLLRIEVQSISQVNNVKISDSQMQDLLLVVESTNITERSDIDFQQDILSTQMTILVSPKRSNSVKSAEIGFKSPAGNTSPGEKSRLSENDILNSIYQADANENMSSVQMRLESSKDVLLPFLSDGENNEDADYPDDFSAEVDNFNSLRYDTDRNRSPISMGKTSEDENFWDS